MSRVLDVGAGPNPDPRADDTLDIQPPADHVADLTEPWPFDAASYDRVIANHVVEHLDELEHFFLEAGRVLTDRGVLEVTVPIGEDAITDHDHETVFRYETPVQFCRDRSRAWDPDVPFVLVARDLDVWASGPESVLWNTPLADALARLFPHWAAHRAYTGELTATYRRVDR